MKPHLVIAVLAPLCGSSIPMGFNMGVLNAPQKYIREWMKYCLLEKFNKVLTAHEEVILWTVVVSMFLVGAMIGSLTCSSIATKIGRKKTLLLSHIICLIASVLFIVGADANYIQVFVIGRFLAGICGGFASSLVPIYFSEVFPCQLKCVSGLIHVVGMSFGILLSNIVGLNMVLGNDLHWIFLSSVTLIGSVLALLAHPFILETPSYSLLNMNNKEQASSTIQKLRSSKEDAEDEISQLNELKAKSNSENTSKDSVDIKTILKTPGCNILLLNVILLFGAQQFSGINGCWFYSSMIFTLAGLDPFQSNLATIFASSTNWIMGMASFFITRKYPRRKLLMTSICGCALSLASMAISLFFSKENMLIPYITMLSFILFIIFFCIGLGALPYILTVEMMPGRFRSAAMSLGASTMWTCNLIVSITLPILNHYIGSFLFCIFMSILIFSGLYFYFFIPETFNKNENTKVNLKKISVISSKKLEVSHNKIIIS